MRLARDPRVRNGPRRADAPRERNAYLLTFQNTGTGAVMIPAMFLRAAIGWYHCPRNRCVVAWVLRTCTASAIAFCLAGSVSRAYWSRSFSVSSSHGQPNIALSQPALANPAITGLRMSAATHEVRNAFQPPALGGSFLARR